MQSPGHWLWIQDSHINQVLTDSITNNGLKLFVITPVGPIDFFMRVLEAHLPFAKNQPIWEALHRYYCGRTPDLIDNRSAPFLTPDGQAFFSDW